MSGKKIVLRRYFRLLMGDVIPSFLIICYLPTTSYPQNLHQTDIRPFLGMVVGGELNRYKKFLPLAKSKNDTIQ